MSRGHPVQVAARVLLSIAYTDVRHARTVTEPSPTTHTLRLALCALDFALGWRRLMRAGIHIVGL